MRIIGLDPGLRATGWGVIESHASRLSYIAHGVIRPTDSLPLGQRLHHLFAELLIVLEQYAPKESAIEETFVNHNATSTLKLGHARGVIMLAPSSRDIPVAEYGANHIKKAIVGAGHASKDQVQAMVHYLLPTAPKELPSDASDALAIAICHAHHLATNYEGKAHVRQA